MEPQRDDSGEIGVFEAALYFSESSNMHGLFPRQISVSNTHEKLKNLNMTGSNIDLHKTPIKGAKKEKERLRLVTLFNSFFHRSNSKKKRLKSQESPVETPKSYPMSPQRNNTWKHRYQCNDGFTGDLWRDRRLKGITVVGKRWVLNNFVAEEGLICNEFSSEKDFSAKYQEENDDELLSDYSSDLFELENCN